VLAHKSVTVSPVPPESKATLTTSNFAPVIVIAGLAPPVGPPALDVWEMSAGPADAVGKTAPEGMYCRRKDRSSNLIITVPPASLM
jgi:hypothetical protein